MTKFFLAAGVAALAIAAPVSADPGKGGGKGGGKSDAAKAERGGGKGQAAKAERGGGKDFKAKGSDREFKSANKWKGNDRSAKAEFKARDRDDDRRFAKFDRKDRDEARDRDFDDDRFDGRFRTAHWDDDGNWCPPGHAKNPQCMPPGQYKKWALGRALPAGYRDRLLPLGLRDLYRDDDDHYYRYANGYAYRVDRDTNLIAALLPLFGGGLMPGQMFPSAFNNNSMPQHFQSFYPNTQDDYFKYANGYVYEVDRDTGRIESMVPLMANGYGMGQMLPLSYSAYNVPQQYRSYYPDGGNSMYRYAPGAIYQVDPQTRLITSVASLLGGQGLSVGQPLPTGYGAYNVPLAYRGQYADSSDAWYRYNNGNIYQVDPTTQLVTALIRAII
ncbi:hypothetical protein [Sphingomonas sp.]|uniref:hypothetical protein n=1 Tax=Sphingomonas sp. TaxID=28214 RepID=UPI0017A0CEB5|nr:hypothetical protein [Sphingomonas sp.]MBA3512718.1 hypothetical protein [Sphingomonas sp.]